ncbi:hypothetical protein IVA94_12310 [Bradyrhizobium sp. 156]|uniref:hypothetical protein n=1 Tax=Bradyrhizobium sp. 156 TaxID=2782630 RepID=UPI001FF87A8E|nr:hypothetical protein [Bradyrhizobium sp. 156]MCK1321662.1 hypothetical protein [Bradyrhizobium sp. 156]
MRMTNPARASKSIALVYLARGAEPDHLARFNAFLESYRRFSACVDHTLFVIFKGFRDDARREAARAVFANCSATAIFTADGTFDIGSYAEALPQIPHDRICFLNTNSEILCEGWLAKLAVNLDQPRVGIVSATASFESLALLDPRFPRFPNVHLRSNAFMMNRKHAVDILPAFNIQQKIDAFLAESGPDSITRRIFGMGLMARVVGRNGRGYQPASWALSETFRRGLQRNLMVHDNVTRTFERSPWEEKKSLAAQTWGEHMHNRTTMLLPG